MAAFGADFMITFCTNFRLLIEPAPGLFLVLCPDEPRHGVVAVSDGYSRSTLTRREDILGEGLLEVLPPDPDDPAASTHEVRPAPVDVTIRPAPAGKRLLVVEDDARSCRVLAALLRTADYTVETAMSGVEALSRLSTYHPDLVLVDISMPGMSGLEFMARARIVRADLRFVAVTGFEPDSDLLCGASVEAHIGKPIEFTVLLRTLAELLLGRASPASMTARRTCAERALGASVI